MKIQFKDYLQELLIDEVSFDKFFRFYNDQFDSYGNEVYEDTRSRLTHLKYFLEDSWWNNRFYYLFKHFENYFQIVDLGFSVPYLPLYLDRIDKIGTVPKLLYVDGSSSSKRLSEIVLRNLNVQAEYVVGDLEKERTWNQIGCLTSPKKKLFCSFETIEHLETPDRFWNNIKRFSGEDVVISLPIGPKIPSHHLSFSTRDEVHTYVAHYIKIREEKVFEGDVNGSDYAIYTCFGTIQ